MKIKKIISCMGCILLLLSVCGCSGNQKALKIYAGDGTILTTVKSEKKVKKNTYRAYADIVVSETAEIIAELEEISLDQAKTVLFSGGYSVYTAFDREIDTALQKVCGKQEKDVNVGSAVTDYNGNLLAVYSSGGKKSPNYSTKATAPCSAFKPISVYAPAIDKGVINWSSRYEDSMYKIVKDEYGVMREWPKNANGVYTMRYAYIYQAIKESLNTVAVKCLNDLGVYNSMSFLESNFSVPLEDEKYTASVYGQDEVIGNLALGSLRKGVSAVDMAGYYQIFGNGGKYEAPKTVLKISDINGKEIFKREYAPKQVIKPTTAEIMNRLLREVVTPDGTGAKAKCDGIEVAGKTGTDETDSNNWFVGITPEYSCAFWHSYQGKNNAASIFSQAMGEIYKAKPEAKKTFSYSSGLQRVAYCTETGKQFSTGCPLIYTGYFTKDNLPDFCNRHY